MQNIIIRKKQELPLVNVAVAVIQREDGYVLMAERPYGKESSGFWEFPGGKFELGESAKQALAREIYEELGIKPKMVYPWIRYKYTYPNKRVKLHVFRIFTWEGTPSGREGQRISWEDSDAIMVSPLLPANNHILEVIKLPLLYVITNTSQSSMVKFMEGLVKVFEQGVRLIKVCTRHMNPEQLTQVTRPIVKLAHHYGAKVLISGNESIALESGADSISKWNNYD
ncbi:MAG: NUDIX domain-containing protein [Nitrosomonadaceae bacterium]|jgi:8-oxo-dGTP diphosphatase|nr:NUDIX domain-containing protein [Nitrosomonadaceae bacterium]